MVVASVGSSNYVNSSCDFNLPDEVVLNNIFSRLEFSDLQRTVPVCKKFKQIADNEELRKLLFEKDFPKQRPILNPAFCAKEQYKYAYLLESNLRSNKCHLSEYPQVHEASIVHVKKYREHLITGSSDETMIISHQGSPHRWVFKEVSNGQFCISGEDLFYASHHQMIIIKKFLHGKEFLETESLQIDGNNIRKFYVEGDLIYAKTQTGTLQVWQKDTEGKFVKLLTLQNIHDFYAKGDDLFLATNQDTIEIWKKNKEGSFGKTQILEKVGAEEFNVSELRFEQGVLIAGCFDASFKVWKIEKKGAFRPLQTWEGDLINFLDSVTAFVVKDGYMIVGCLKGELLILKKDEIGAFHQIQKLKAHTDRIRAIQFECGRLLTASLDGKAKIWLLDEKGEFKEILSWGREGKAVLCAEIDGSHFMTGYADGSFEIRDFSPIKKREDG
jgi:WD40 repeat protein